MPIRRLIVLLPALLLAGCAGWTVRPLTPAEEASLGWDALSADVRRAYAAEFQDIPFADGAISVVAPDGHEMRTYRLVPCAAGRHVCAGSAHGPRGHVDVTLDYWIVRGLYGATFYLSPGGDGGLRRPGHPDTWLAWEAVAEH